MTIKKETDNNILNEIFLLKLMNQDCATINDFIERYYLPKLFDEPAHSTFAAVLKLQKSICTTAEELIKDLDTKVR